MPYIPPPYTLSRLCPCGAEVPLQLVTPTNPRNAGRLYYLCLKCHKWYQWGDDLGNSPNNSPTTSPTVSRGNAPPSAPVPSQPMDGHEQAGEVRHQLGCSVTMVGRQCQRNIYHAAGECMANGHTSSGSPLPPSSSTLNSDVAFLPSSSMSNGDVASRTLPGAPLINSHSSVSCSMSNIDRADLSTSLNPAPHFPLPAASSTADLPHPTINPRHASKLCPISVEHAASVREGAEKKRQRDQELAQDKKRARERVIAFSFYTNDAEPVTVDFQDGFIYPYFRLTRAVLIDLELIPPDGEMATPSAIVHYFDPALDTWIKMKIDSIIELTKPSQRLFFKGLHVTSYPRFKASVGSREPNLLSQERNYVKQTQTYTKARALDTLDTLLKLSSDEDCNDPPFTSSPKKRRTESNQPQRLMMPHDLQSRHAVSDSDDVISIHDDDSIVFEKLVHTPITARLIPGIDSTTAKFPISFYSVDIHAAFCFKPSKLTLQSQFERFFGVPWKSSTYYDHKAKWYNAPQDARDRAIAAGYSDAGHYSLFSKAHSVKHAELKVAKQKLRASQHN